MNNKIIKIFAIIIVICTICTFIALSSSDNGLPDDEDKVCRYVSYNNIRKNYGSYVTVYEGKYTMFGKDIYVFTDEYYYSDYFYNNYFYKDYFSNVYFNNNYVTYSLYMDGDEIKHYCNFAMSGYEFYIAESYYRIPHITKLPDTSVVVRADNSRTVYLNGDIYDGGLIW